MQEWVRLQLRQWMRQPWVAVSRQEAVGYATARWFDAASVCFDWLVRRGYINYGCAQVPISKGRRTKGAAPRRKAKTIVVIGAGMSGLGCARHLDTLVKQYTDKFHDLGQEPPKVVVLEGRVPRGALLPVKVQEQGELTRLM